ncbi:MAG TPA: hypothetical protein VNX01_14315, partial [Bacteroidia bacterium]|nr:hypothetical protein [Bacteroidia bacterium]
MKYFSLFCIGILLFTQNIKAQTSYTWNGATSTNWGTATNWTPNGIPGGNAGDNVTIVTGSNNCVLNANTAITNITMTSGTLDLGGFTLSPIGNAIFTAGIITHGTLTINGAAANTALLTNTAFSATNVLNITTGAITINGGTYGGAVTLNQTGATNINCNGGATFGSTLSLTVSGSGYFFMHGGCTYNGATTFNYSGSNGNGFLPELNTGSTYNGNLTLNNTATAGNLRMAYAGATAFNGNVVVSNTGSGNFTFCESAGATATLANTKTISVGGSGFTAGTLTMSRFTQVGATAQNLVFTGSASMTFNNSTTFNGALTVSAPNIYTSNSTYNGVTILTKTDGTTSNNFVGGNTFNNTLTLNYTAANAVNAYWGFAANTPDIYNGDLYVNNSSTDRILWGVGASVGNQLNGNLIVTQTGTAVGISTAWSAGTTWTMAAGKNISIGAAGFTTGYLGVSGLTTSSPVNLITTGSSSVYLGTTSGTAPSTFGSSVTVTAPNIYVRGTTINGVTVLTKTDGTTSNNSTGGNTFNNTLTLNYTASNAVNVYWGFAANTPDIYNGDLYVNNSSTDRILWGVGASVGNQLNGNLIITQTGTAVGIATAWSAGTTWTTAAGKNISIGGAGFTVGYLGIGGLTTSSPLNLVTTGSSAVYLGTIAGVTPCAFGSTVNITAPDIYVRGNTFNAPAYFTKTGGVSNHNNGNQNIFNASCNVNQQSNGGYFMLGYNSNEQFNDSIIVTSTGTGGIALGWNAGTGTPTLASGKTVFIGSAGFSTGYLRFGGFTQLGSVPINLTLTGTAAFYVNSNTSGTSIFNAVFNATAPDIYVQGGTFNSRAYFTKTGGTSNNNAQIQNIFNASCNVNQQSSAGYFMLGYNSNDMFNDSIIVSSSGTGGIYFGANNTLGTPTLASGKSIFVGAGGFSAGFLVFNHFTQLGNADVNLAFSGASAA